MNITKPVTQNTMKEASKNTGMNQNVKYSSTLKKEEPMSIIKGNSYLLFSSVNDFKLEYFQF